MGLTDSPAKVLERFQGILNTSLGGQVDRERIIQFVNTSFTHPGTEFDDWYPPDWHESPQFLSHITDKQLRSWASDLHDLWKSLGRKISQNVKDQPDRHSQIYVPNPVIVPGGRFIEFYYWDSYWVINGLLLSEMYDTARGMIENFLYMVDNYGFIPNGGRVYYLNRSQPPFLTLMMESYMARHSNMTFLRENINLLKKEYDFWMTKRNISVEQNGRSYTLNRYNVLAGGPRPESYSKDYEMALKLAEDAKPSFYAELKSAAESGWDFSSRWFYGSTNSLLDTQTRSVIPVDLNAILCRVERMLAKFYTDLGMPAEASKFTTALNQRIEAVQAVLWEESLGTWLDYNIKETRKNRNFYPTNLTPLWASCYTDSAVVDKAVSYLESSGALSYKNGLPTSLKDTGEQWDFPNAWPPLQHMVIEGLEKTESKKAKDAAFLLAQKWVRANYEAYKKYKAMFEKYDVQGDGKPGGGGEYEVQLGFGWTNGVILQLLDLYRSRITSSAISISFSGILFTLPCLIITFWL
ncbi:hypothetical protein GDO81_014431 [Engystomops pustulosus]|uniref:Trehalase n=2 Tax=Engystomops pustulosus TaxID=76066 RepID=A0AAV7BA97_ENGPU|nr:hypothetical protein GDO81_014431 [Engystomops pustulosus]